LRNDVPRRRKEPQAAYHAEGHPIRAVLIHSLRAAIAIVMVLALVWYFHIY
jgi:hypothetical protein